MVQSSLIISTYNWPQALDLVLASVEKQTTLPDEVLIADDGSTKETEAVVQKYIAKKKLNIKHIWQEDKGFRVSEIRNKAIAVANYEYIIQIDGDCVLHQEFVKDHLKHASPNTLLGSSRVILLEKLTQKILFQQKFKFCFFVGGYRNRFNAVWNPQFSELFSQMPKDKLKMLYRFRGCNMSYWKNDALKINGYDNEIQGWGREDSDFLVRMINLGISLKKVKFSCVMYHLYHQENEKGSLEKNTKKLEDTIKPKKIFVEDGIFKKKN